MAKNFVVHIPPLNLQEEFVGVVARVESLPLTSFGDFVRGRMGASQSTRQVEGLFVSLLAEAFLVNRS
jgi:hypothetical protein